MMNEELELRKIKDVYGEDLMHICRRELPMVLSTPGKLFSILSRHLAPTKSLANLIKGSYVNNFVEWILSIANNTVYDPVIVDKTPYELMDEAGYKLYRCETYEDILAFKHYYYQKYTEKDNINEVLCTFNDSKRINSHIVFFAVKKNVDEIKRENFAHPERQDAYGTSVISIQFTKTAGSRVSIKNRYNHTVPNPDVTFDNDLENIIPGLTKSFEIECHIRIQPPNKNTKFFECVNYVSSSSEKFYLCNYELGDTICCENNILIREGKVDKTYALNKERYIVMDQYLVDLKDKTISVVDGDDDSFVQSIKDVGKIKRIETGKNNGNKIIRIIYENEDNEYKKIVNIEINKSNSIIGYENNYVTNIGRNFFSKNRNVRYVSLNNVVNIDDNFLNQVEFVETVLLQNVKVVADGFMSKARRIKEIILPNVISFGDSALESAQLRELYVPKLKKVGKQFLFYNTSLSTFSFPELEEIDIRLLTYNRDITDFYAPKLRNLSRASFSSNLELLEKISTMLKNHEPVIITSEEKRRSM